MKNIKSTEYIYDIKAKELKNMPYELAILRKISAAKELLHKLTSVNWKDRDDERVGVVYKAVKFNEKLLEELKEK